MVTSIPETLLPFTSDIKLSNNRSLLQVSMLAGKDCFTLFTPQAVQNNHGKILIVVYIILSVFVTLANLTVLIGLWKSTQRLTTSQRLFFLLSLMDFFVGAFFSPLQAYMISISNHVNCKLIMVQAFISMFFPYISALILLIIIIHRCCIVVNTEFCRKLLTTKNIVLALGGITIFSISISIWYVFQKITSSNKSHGIFYLNSGILIMGYLVIVNTVNYKLISFVNEAAKNNAVLSSTRRNSYHKHVSKTLVLLSILITLCYFPMGISFLISGISLISKKQIVRLHVIQIMIPWSQIVMSMNSGINSSIYVLRTNCLYHYYSNIFRKTINRNQNLSYRTRDLENKSGKENEQSM